MVSNSEEFEQLKVTAKCGVSTYVQYKAYVCVGILIHAYIQWDLSIKDTLGP